jgi:hypothetical protein
MANKPEFVDLISAATRQNRRSAVKKVAAAEPAEARRLSHWPPDHVEQWRLVNLTSWKIKLKPWKFKDWV